MKQRPRKAHPPILLFFCVGTSLRMISYGSGIREIWSNGVRNTALDSVVYLNENHLSKEISTIHEELANRKLSSASINGLLYRGSFKHQLNVPRL